MNIFLYGLASGQHLSFIVHPIAKNKFEASLKIDKWRRRSSQPSLARSLKINDQDARADWSLVMRPRRLFKLMMVDNCVSNKFAMSLFLHCSVLLYLLFKCCFHAIFTRSDKNFTAYTEAKLLFPRILESFPGNDLLYKLNISIALYGCCMKFKNVHNLIESSILNKDGYRRLDVPQVDLGSLLVPNCTLNQWWQLICDGLRHDCCKSFDSLRRHLHLRRYHQGESRKRQLNQSNWNSRLYDVNLIDFEQCYRGKHQHLFELSRIQNQWHNIHHSKPIHRIDFNDWAIMALIYALSAIFAIFATIGVVTCVSYMEITAAMQDHGYLSQSTSVLDVIRYVPAYLTEPWRLIRFMDATMMAFTVIPNVFDAQIFGWSALTLWSRTKKLNRILAELAHFCVLYKNCRLLGHPESDQLTPEFFLQHSLLFDDQEEEEEEGNQTRSPMSFQSGLMDKKLQEDLNRKVEQLMGLINHLSAEFHDLKRRYSSYLTMLIAYGALSVAYCTSLIFEAKSFSIYFCLVAAMMCFGLPAAFSLYYSVVVERGVSMAMWWTSQQAHQTPTD